MKHDTTRENGTLILEQKVYTFQNKKTTSTQTLDKWLEEEFDLIGTISYRKIEAVDIETKKFYERSEDK